MSAQNGPTDAGQALAEGAPVVTEAAVFAEDSPERWELRLYVAGRTLKCVRALANLREVCATHLAGQYRIEVVDLLEHPRLAADDQILAIPTLVRKLPEPISTIVGDLSDTERVLVGLQIRPAREPERTP